MPATSTEMEHYMRTALRLADNAGAIDEVPVGALIVRDGLLMGEGHNQNVQAADPTAHAEVVALRDACAYEGNYRLNGAAIFVTLEPCLMCFAALVHARIHTLVYGAGDPKRGYSQFLSEADLTKFNHRMTIIPGVLQDEATAKIQAFFRAKRERGKRKWMRPQS